MNDIDLPPSRPLPPHTRDRLRDTVLGSLPAEEPPRGDRFRAPLAAAAAVAVLAAGAVIVAQSAGAPDRFRPGTTTSATTSTTVSANPPTTFPLLPGLVPEPVDGRTAEALDRCGAVAAASPRANEFAPRSSWEPVFTVEKDGHRITAFKEYGGKPGFCETTATTATVSDPSAEPMSLGITIAGGGEGGQSIDAYGLHVSETGVLAGVAQGAAMLSCLIEYGGNQYRLTNATLVDDVFVADMGDLADGDRIDTTLFDADGDGLASGEITFEWAKARPPGATATDR